MMSQFSRLTSTEEKIHFEWQTAPIVHFPAAIPKLAVVVNAIETHFLTLEWTTIPRKGSVTFQRSKRSRWLVRAFIDDGNRLARHFGKAYPPEPIVVGVDLTEYDPFTRFAIREAFRARHGHNYIDPEAVHPTIEPRKIIVRADRAHFLDVLFIPDVPCDFPLDEERVNDLIETLEKGRR